MRLELYAVHDADAKGTPCDAAPAGPWHPETWIAEISRELRMPLTAVLGYAELLADDGLDASTRLAFAEEIRHGGARLLRCLEEFVELTRLRSPSYAPLIRELDPRALLRDVAAGLTARATARQIDLVAHAAGTVPERLLTDGRLLTAALEQLAGNAVEHAVPGPVTLALDWEAGRLRVAIQDGGPGIDPALHSTLFDSFCPAAKQGGLVHGPGLGLAITRASAQRLGGDVRLERSDAGGSLFVLEVQAGAAVEARPADGPAPAPRQLRRKNGLCGRRILLADDSPGDRRLIEFVLRKQGADVTPVEDGQAALAALEQGGGRFDLILMDMDMPVLNGTEATRRLRALGYTLPVVALTANALDEDRQVCLEAGCNAFMTKPVRQRDLTDRILDFVEQP